MTTSHVFGLFQPQIRVDVFRRIADRDKQLCLNNFVAVRMDVTKPLWQLWTTESATFYHVVASGSDLTGTRV